MPVVAEEPNAAPLVSVAMITFNHARYVRQAVESVFQQCTPFAVELVVGDDCSTDETPLLLQELAQRFPTLRLLQRPVNLGMTRNFFDVLRQCRGRYIALLEGDDYWTDPEKLALQVELMDAHSEVKLCHHRVAHLNEASGQLTDGPSQSMPEITSGHLLLNGVLPDTCSVMYRRKFDDFPEWLHELSMGDWPSHLLHALSGKLGYIDRQMAVYRRHSAGVWTRLTQIEGLKKRIAAASVLARSLPVEYQAALEKTRERFANDAAELLLKEDRELEALAFIEAHSVPTAGFHRLRHFYSGLALERSRRRLAALKEFLRAAWHGRGVTRIGGKDLAIAAVRTAAPNVYRRLRDRFGRR